MMMFSARDRLKLLLGASAMTLSACGGGGSSSAPAPVGSVPPTPPPPPPPPPTGVATGLLRDTYRSNFNIGTALNNAQVQPLSESAEIARDQFDVITPEYELKLDQIAPTEGALTFDAADRIVDWALTNNMAVRGHALLWHEATPDYFLQGSPNDIRQRLEDYIAAVIDHFKDRIHIWDVANEVISVDIYNGPGGIGPDRRSAWYDAVGSADYLDWAFRAARAADPTAELYLSDYDTENPIKRDWLIEILQRFRTRGVPIDGVGHQFHFFLSTSAADALASIDAVDNEFMGLINHVTELDVNFYDDPGSCWNSNTGCEADLGLNPPAAMLATQAQLLRDLMDGLTQRSSVEMVNLWGVKDDDSWLNRAPIERVNHPLLFDRSGEPKSAFLAITDANYVI
jgi:endo-1,4-beta-xylanase